MTPVGRRIAAMSLGVIFAVATGCALDFTVRSNAGDGGGPPDGRTDAPAADAPADAGPDAPAVADTGADVDCIALATGLVAKKEAARACKQTGADCMTTVPDECGCDVVVAQPDSTATLDYADAAGRYAASGCQLNCAGKASCPSATTHQCLVQGTVTVCYQQ